MFLAKVIGKTWSNNQHYSYDGIELKIIQDVNPETMEFTGKPMFAIDAVKASLGELVAYEVSAEAGKAFNDKKVLADTAITAIIDSATIPEYLKLKGQGK